MKLRSEKGRFILTDGDKEIIYDTVLHAMCYMFVMFNFRSIPCVTPSPRPVRSLTPNPKPIVLTLEDKIKISRIKANMPICTI